MEPFPALPPLRRSAAGLDQSRGTANASWDRPMSKVSMKVLLLEDYEDVGTQSKQSDDHKTTTVKRTRTSLTLDDEIEQLLMKLRSTTFVGDFQPADHAGTFLPSSSPSSPTRGQS